MAGSNVWDDSPLYSQTESDINPSASIFASMPNDSSSAYPNPYSTDSPSNAKAALVSDTLTADSQDENASGWSDGGPPGALPSNEHLQSSIFDSKNELENNVDEFKIQNELAHTMKSILLNDEQRDNPYPNEGRAADSHDGYGQTDHVHYEDNNIHRKSDVGNPFLANSFQNQDEPQNDYVDISILKEKKNELLNSLTKESNSHPFLKDDEGMAKFETPLGESGAKNMDLFALSPEKTAKGLNNGIDDTALENLLTLAGPSGNLKAGNEEKSSTSGPSSEKKLAASSSKQSGIVSPNRKVQILRPRRINKLLRSEPSSADKDSCKDGDGKQASLDPLSAPLLVSQNADGNRKNVDLTSISPNSRKQKFIKESEAPLFNVNKDRVLKENPQLPLPSDSSNTTDAKTVFANYKYEDEDVEKLDITVGDPLKVGELTNAHVVYTINTKTKCELFSLEETVVTRRYSDFLWLYHQLLNNHPGYIIPPPPEKQVYGRFDDKFIENRRLALENMLINIAKRKVLQRDPDFIMFLQSENFSEESKEREAIVYHTSNPASTDKQAKQYEDDTSNKSMETMAQILNVAATLGIAESSSSGGFFSSLIGLNTPKYVEEDAFILEQQAYFGSLDSQLRQLSQSLDMILEKRDELSFSLNDVSTVLQRLADLEVNTEITEILNNFAELQTKIKELLDRGNLSQVLTFGSTIDEYIRLIGSVRNCFDNRLKVCNSIATIQQHQEKKEHNLIKFRAKNQNQPDKIKRLEDELANFNTVLDQQLKFKQEYDKTFKSELARFDFDRIKDFKNMIEIYWEGLIENQKMLIELWESFYEKCKFDA